MGRTAGKGREQGPSAPSSPLPPRPQNSPVRTTPRVPGHVPSPHTSLHGLPDTVACLGRWRVARLAGRRSRTSKVTPVVHTPLYAPRGRDARWRPRRLSPRPEQLVPSPQENQHSNVLLAECNDTAATALRVHSVPQGDGGVDRSGWGAKRGCSGSGGRRGAVPRGAAAAPAPPPRSLGHLFPKSQSPPPLPPAGCGAHS